jgi:hypothetical protein
MWLKAFAEEMAKRPLGKNLAFEVDCQRKCRLSGRKKVMELVNLRKRMWWAIYTTVVNPSANLRLVPVSSLVPPLGYVIIRPHHVSHLVYQDLV